MPPPPRPPLIRLRLIALVLLASAVTLALVRALLLQAVLDQGPRRVPLAQGTPEPGALPPPYAYYAAVDPALVPVLLGAPLGAPVDALAVIVPGVPPIGAYLPLSGDAQLALPTPTLTPAIPPLPTLTPTITPTQPPTLTPLPTLDATALARAEQFGAGLNCAPAGWPVMGVLTQYFRWYHRGMDIGVPSGTAVLATHTGIIAFAGWRTDGYGNLIILQSGIFTTYYGHLSSFNVQQGQIVSRGELIGWSGNTGRSTGPHVHYEIRIHDQEVDPLTFEDRGYPPC